MRHAEFGRLRVVAEQAVARAEDDGIDDQLERVDDRGGCYSAGLTTTGNALDTRTRGEACPNGVNGLRWWSHPDGSPDSMGWAPAP